MNIDSNSTAQSPKSQEEKSGRRDMSYIDYLNQFSRWLKNHTATDKAIVLYVGMLMMFNERFWPEWAGVTTEQLMKLANTTNRKAALAARDALVDAGLLEYRPGWKGVASVYRLLKFGCESATEKFGCELATEKPEYGCELVTENGKYGCESVTPNLCKTSQDFINKDTPYGVYFNSPPLGIHCQSAVTRTNVSSMPSGNVVAPSGRRPPVTCAT